MILKSYSVTQNNVKQIVTEEKSVMKGARALTKEEVTNIKKSFWGKYAVRAKSLFIIGLYTGHVFLSYYLWNAACKKAEIKGVNAYAGYIHSCAIQTVGEEITID